MEDGFGVKQALLDIFQQLSDFAVQLVPRLVTGLVVLLVGVLIAKIVQRVLRSVLLRLRFDMLLERMGILGIFQNMGVRGSLSESIAQLIYYVLVILFLQGAANAVGLLVISEAIESFFTYLPNIVAAVLILLLGNVVGQFARRAVEESGRDSGLDYAPALGRTVAAGILFIVAIMAITQLGIDTAMIRIIVIVALSGAAAAFALSFGLGTRELTRNIVGGFYARKLFRIGDPMEVDGERGVLSAVTSTKALLEQDGKTLSVANAKLLEQNTKQDV